MVDVVDDTVIRKDKGRAGRRYLKRLVKARKKSIEVMVDFRFFKSEKEARDRMGAKRLLKSKKELDENKLIH